MKAQAVCIDQIIAPSFNYGGLAYDNPLSMSHQNRIAYPKKAALQGLEKMYAVYQNNVAQYVLPPLKKNPLLLLKKLGFSSKDPFLDAFEANPKYLAQAFSSSSCWMANAGTFSPSSTSATNTCHVTLANLATHRHRSMDVLGMHQLINDLFHQHHVYPALDNTWPDEGAANSVYLGGIDLPILHLFSYAKTSRQPKALGRQSEEACDAIILKHHLKKDHVLKLQQHPEALKKGMFHTDVLCFGAGNLFIAHEKTFASGTLKPIKQAFNTINSSHLDVFEISELDFPIKHAIETYFFNTQLIYLGNQRWIAFFEKNLQHNHLAQSCLKDIKKQLNGTLSERYVDVSESLKNGGGPACLRLLCLMNTNEIQNLNQRYCLTQKLYENLKEYIQHHYPDTLHIHDFLSASFRKKINAITTSILNCWPKKN